MRIGNFDKLSTHTKLVFYNLSVITLISVYYLYIQNLADSSSFLYFFVTKSGCFLIVLAIVLDILYHFLNTK